MRKTFRNFIPVGVAVSLVVPLLLGPDVTSARAANPVGWRSDGTGRFPTAQPPSEWSEDKNVLWKTELPDRSHSGPVVVSERIFVTAEPDYLLCLNASDGKILWKRRATLVDVFGADRAAEIEANEKRADELEKSRRVLRRKIRELRKSDLPPKDQIEALQKQERELREKINELTKFAPSRRGAGNTTATPVCDGTFVYAVFGNGVVVSYSVTGEKHWFRHVEPSQLNFGHSASPVIAGGKVIVHFHHLVALDVGSGKEVWRAEIPARHGSAVVASVGGQQVVITPGGAVVRASDGEVLAEKLFQAGHASPIVQDGVVYAMGQGKVFAIDMPKTATRTAQWTVRWEGRGFRQRTFASPLYVNGRLYNVTEKGILDVVDASNGRLVLRKRLEFGGGRVYPSPTLAGSLLYISNDRGTTLVLDPDNACREVVRNELENFSGAPVFVGNRMFVRGRKHMYCIGR